MGNGAIVANEHPAPHGVNGATSAIGITTHGSNWYFAVTAVMIVSTFAFIGLSFTRPRSHRIFHYITAAITLVAAIAYFTMGSDLGQTPIEVEFKRSNPKVSGTATNQNLMIVTGLVGALVQSKYKWAYFTFGCAAFLWVVWTLAFTARKHAIGLGADVSRTYLTCGVWTMFLWFLYPIAWGLSEGGNVIAPDSEAVYYGVLDLMAKPVFGALLLWGHRNIDPARLGLHIRDYDDDPATTSGTHAGHHGEKRALGDSAVANGDTTTAPGTTMNV
ncbi:MAG: hypothetical protein Q9196_001813 [Gyalolechia fulgens]